MIVVNCAFCGKPNEGVNYCDWECHIALAKQFGGEVHTPNGLPISCIKADGSMWEHEDADHPDYKFPVSVELDPLSRHYDMCDCNKETHALIYTDGFIALTTYECCYYSWSLKTGEGFHGLSDTDWKLTEVSLNEIKEWLKK